MSSAAPRHRPRPVGVAVLAVAALALVGLIASLSLDTGDENPIDIKGAGVAQQLLGGIPQEGAELGSESAPVTVELLNDMQCVDCAAYQLEVIDPLIAGPVRAGDLRLSYRHYAVGSNATSAASFGAVAAAQQDRQWQFIELFAINQDEAREHGVSAALLERIAAAVLELDTVIWRQDLDAPAVEHTVTRDAELTAELRIPAEPAVIVQGPAGTKQLTESPSLAAIEAAIREVSG